jgi:hypothetical protein
MRRVADEAWEEERRRNGERVLSYRVSSADVGIDIDGDLRGLPSLVFCLLAFGHGVEIVGDGGGSVLME